MRTYSVRLPNSTSSTAVAAGNKGQAAAKYVRAHTTPTDGPLTSVLVDDVPFIVTRTVSYRGKAAPREVAL